MPAAHAFPQVGDTIADASVVDSDGAQQSLGELARGGALLLFVYRGSWCGFCLRRLADYNRQLARIERLGIRVAALSADEPEFSQRMKRLLKLPFDILSDPDAELISAWGLRNPREKRTAFPATMLLDHELAIQFITIDNGYAAASVNDVLDQCEQILRMQNLLPEPRRVFRFPGVMWLLRAASNEMRMRARGFTR